MDLGHPHHNNSLLEPSLSLFSLLSWTTGPLTMGKIIELSGTHLSSTPLSNTLTSGNLSLHTHVISMVSIHYPSSFFDIQLTSSSSRHRHNTILRSTDPPASTLHSTLLAVHSTPLSTLHSPLDHPTIPLAPAGLPWLTTTKQTQQAHFP